MEDSPQLAAGFLKWVVSVSKYGLQNHILFASSPKNGLQQRNQVKGFH
jgi:hypothetical protein